MNDSISILIIEDDEEACRRFEDIIYIDTELKISAITNNSYSGINYLREYQPDVVILDLELHKGSGSGIDFLKFLNENSVFPKPYIIVTTNNSSSLTYNYVHDMGGDFIFSKYEDDYSEQKVISLILTMKSIIKRNKQQPPLLSGPNTSPANQKKQLHKMIATQLHKLGISPKVLGYKYLIDAILLLIENSNANVYSTIGAAYHKTSTSVERAMQNAIDKAWRTANTSDLENYYTARIDINRGAPTVTEFMYYYVDKIKNENNL